MSRRRFPRPATSAFRTARERAAPQTPLATVQAAWSRAVGAQVAAVAEPVAERDGEVVVECVEAIWAQELDLMQNQLLSRLAEELGEAAPKSLKFRLRKGD